MQNASRSRIASLILLLILVQPLLDVLSFWLNARGIGNTVTLGLRLGLLVGVLLLGICLSDHKRIYLYTAGVLILYTAGHVVACIQIGYAQPFKDLTNQVRIFLLPLTAISFMTFLQELPDAWERVQRGFLGCLCMIGVICLLSRVTGTDPCTYPDKRIGVLGWFYFANSQSAILSMLVPVSIVYVARRWGRFLPTAAVSILGLGLLFLLGTRLSYFALILTGLGLCVTLWVCHCGPRSGAVFLLVLTVLFGVLLPVSPMVKNQTLVAKNAVIKQEKIDTMVAQDTEAGEQAGLTEEELQYESLRSAYETYLEGLVGNFGLQRTAAFYDYSDRASDICDVRRAKISYSEMLLEDSPILSYVFGMELGRWDYEDMSYDVENDFHGIFFLCGGAGLFLLLCFLGYYVFQVLRGLGKAPKRVLSPEVVGLSISCIGCAAHIYATAGVLRRPNASFYLAVCLAAVWYLVRKPKKTS
jgi:hypothetical protein